MSTRRAEDFVAITSGTIREDDLRIARYIAQHDENEAEQPQAVGIPKAVVDPRRDRSSGEAGEGQQQRALRAVDLS